MYPGAHREDFDRLVRVLRETRGKWLLSNVDHPKVREAFKGYHILEAKVPWSTGNRFRAKQKVGREILIANYDISAERIVEKSGGQLKSQKLNQSFWPQPFQASGSPLRNSLKLSCEKPPAPPNPLIFNVPLNPAKSRLVPLSVN